MYKLIAHETAINTEEKCEQQSGAHQIHEGCAGKKDQGQHTYSGQCELAGRESADALVQHRRHYRIGFHHAVLQEAQCHEGVGATEDHDANREEEQPGVMPVGEQVARVLDPSQGSPIRTQKAK